MIKHLVFIGSMVSTSVTSTALTLFLLEHRTTKFALLTTIVFTILPTYLMAYYMNNESRKEQKINEVIQALDGVKKETEQDVTVRRIRSQAGGGSWTY